VSFIEGNVRLKNGWCNLFHVQADTRDLGPNIASSNHKRLTIPSHHLVRIAFRNGFLEDLHAGKSSPILDQPSYSRISHYEMRRLMIEASAKLEQMLQSAEFYGCSIPA
jgi:hypothetical protein